MGSGKTTVGRLLAARLGWTFLDLDDHITDRCGISVPELFSSFGEAHFRREESRSLAACLEQANTVLALGGGVPESDANRTLLRRAPGTAIVYLQGPFNTLHARCLEQSVEPGAVTRPVLADVDAARERFTRRTPLYEEIATLTVDARNTPQSIADVLSALLGL